MIWRILSHFAEVWKKDLPHKKVFFLSPASSPQWCHLHQKGCTNRKRVVLTVLPLTSCVTAMNYVLPERCRWIIEKLIRSFQGGCTSTTHSDGTWDGRLGETTPWGHLRSCWDLSREGRSWIQGGTNNRCLLRSFWTRKGKEGEEEGSDVGQGVRSEEEFSECPSSSCSFSAASSSSNYVSDLIPLLNLPLWPISSVRNGAAG